MRNFLNTLKNIWTIEDLRTRILNTLGLILVYRIGSFIILPGVDADLLEANTSDAEGLAGIINMFAGLLNMISRNTTCCESTKRSHFNYGFLFRNSLENDTLK